MDTNEEYDWDTEVQIIDNTVDAMEKYGFACGSDFIELSQEKLTALLSGKVIAWSNGEYNTFLKIMDK